jgi:hypothetical protein
MGIDRWLVVQIRITIPVVLYSARNVLWETSGLKNELIGLTLAVVLIFFGFAIIRVGLVGKYLDYSLVSYVKKCEHEPQWYHGCITAGTGILAAMLGTCLFIFLLLSHSKVK